MIAPSSIKPANSFRARAFIDSTTTPPARCRLVEGNLVARFRMTVRPNRNWAYVVVACIATCMSSRAEQPFQAVDPGVRLGYANAGTVVRGVDAGYFANTRFAFQEVHSIAGDIESGAGLGPRFNGTSCGGCHAYPALRG